MAAPVANNKAPLPIVPQLQMSSRILPLRVAAMFKVLVSLRLELICFLGEIVVMVG